MILWQEPLNNLEGTVAFSKENRYNNIVYGIVKVSTGALQLEKLSAGDASNRKPKYKR